MAAIESAQPDQQVRRDAQGREVIYRHVRAVRATHWINFICISVLLFSGLQIFNAHPRLYWGQYGAQADQPALQMYSTGRGDAMRGYVEVGPWRLETTGLFGASHENGALSNRGFPAWLTLPGPRDLAGGRLWHFFFAWIFVLNLAVYFWFAANNRHISRDLMLTREEARPGRLLRDLWHHVQLKIPRGEASKRYNPIQKIAYLGVLLVLLPLVILTGLTMSPGFNAVAPFLLDVFAGRQSARTIHFIAASLIVLFVIVHVFEVFLAGVVNEVRSMITGWYVVQPERRKP